MLLYEFTTLSDDDKANFVWEHGRHLVNIEEGEVRFALYTTKDFFVELQLKENKIDGIRSFKKGEVLNRYIDRVDLLKLMNE